MLDSATIGPTNRIHPKSTARKSSYRPEIDGLRAFAVAVVIINHFNSNLLPGGYLGVDIFFVISGYVITSSLSEKESGSFQDFIAEFYVRRIKRLVPALSAFTLITSIIICFFNSNPYASLKTGIFALAGLSNIHLFSEATNYFGDSVKLNAFTHTWSLGVEEQFYIAFPFLVWLSGFARQRKNGALNLSLSIGVLAVASLIFYVNTPNQSAAYFLMPARFWEMAAGCLIFIGFKKQEFIQRAASQIPPTALLAAIIFIMLLPSPTRWSTILLILLTAILVVSLKRGTIAYQIFTQNKVIYVGLISYSLYLWHWAVLTISRLTIGIHWWSVPFQIAIILACSVASYRYIETPFRKAHWFSKRWQTLAFGLVVLLTTSGFLAALAKPLKGRLFMGGLIQIEKQEWSWPGKNVPNVNINKPFSKGQDCLKGVSEHTSCFFYDNNSKKTLWLIGDSHAATLYKSGVTVAYNQKMNFKLFTAGGTAFPPASRRYRKTERLSDLKKISDYKLLQDELLLSLSDGDVVLIGLRHPYHFGATYYEYPESDFIIEDERGKSIPHHYSMIKWKNALKELAMHAEERGAIIIIQTPTPEWKDEVLRKCSIQTSHWFNLPKKLDCKLEKSFFANEKSGLYRNLIKELQSISRSSSNIYLLDTFNIACPGPICSFTTNGKDIYADDDHLHGDWAHGFVTDKLKKAIEYATKKRHRNPT